MFGNLHLPRKGVPVVLLSHGLESDKDGSKWLMLSERLYEAGWASLRFSYRGCGEREEKSDGDFEDTTLTGRISDYRAALDFLQQQTVDVSRIGVIGSSLGGMVALAARDERVKAMVTLATPATLHFPAEAGWNKDHVELSSGRRLKPAFFEDVGRYDASRDINQIRCPVLIVQGTADELVRVEHARRLWQAANQPKRLEIIEGANHGFDEPAHREEVVMLSLDWFKQYL
jgi:dipeptidyl aminopeptidase/acylaminoacyl peptidase